MDLSKSTKSKFLKKNRSEQHINGVEYGSRLRQNQQAFDGRPKWALIAHPEILSSVNSCIENEQLLPDIIEVERLLDVTNSLDSTVFLFKFSGICTKLLRVPFHQFIFIPIHLLFASVGKEMIECILFPWIILRIL